MGTVAGLSDATSKQLCSELLISRSCFHAASAGNQIMDHEDAAVKHCENISFVVGCYVTKRIKHVFVNDKSDCINMQFTENEKTFYLNCNKFKSLLLSGISGSAPTCLISVSS